ncbi:quinone oxidoreductase [Parahaliea maris]|uniref:NADPH:quinone reductase n=1 Tax=Parahaliea maris TaxID=2716870 RepID=A0A5C8ZUL1_9GAMM|nr:quinone oxidoreductase [Parahaliea maris]TXS92146.1 quinone oxidoreductase [Parahaliea maris]
MPRAVQISEAGGPEVMELRNVPLVEPGPGMVQVENRAIGLNFIDTYHRNGLYPLPLPTGLGTEGAGVVTAVGEGADLAVGDRVAYCSAGIGSYAEVLNLPAARLVKIPEGVDFEIAAAVMLKGQTVEYLLQRCFPLNPGQTCVFHAAAGGVGLLFGQWASALGATVIGTVSSAAKAELARAHGYHHVINYAEQDVAQAVADITGGVGVPVVYDGVGRDTFEASLSCLQPRGMLVSFGNASGAPEPVDLQRLALGGSLYVTRPTLVSYTGSTGELRDSAAAVFERVLDGRLKVEIQQRYPLERIADAHRDLEARRTTGSTVILP